LFLFAFLFLMIMAMHFSIKLSKLTGQIKDLTQEIGILRTELEEPGKAKEPERRGKEPPWNEGAD